MFDHHDADADGAPEGAPEGDDAVGARHRAAWLPEAGPVLDADPEVRRAQLHADLDALLDGQRTDPGASSAEALVGWDRLRRAVDGALVAVVSGWSRSGVWALDAYRSPSAWMIGTLGMKRAAAGSLRTVCEAAADHPGLAAAAASGRLSIDHLRALLSARVAPLDGAFDEDVDALVAAAARMSVDALGRHLAEWRFDALADLGENEPDGPEPVDPPGTTCTVRGLLWGRARAELDLDPIAAAEFTAGLEHEYGALRRAGAFDADPRSLDEVYGDIAMEIWRRGCARTGPSSVVPLITATVDIDTLLRRAGTTDPAARARRVARIDGHGPIDDATVAELAARADVALLITGAGGAPLWCGRARRLATPAQRAAVTAASNGHCGFPGCTVAAARCEIDHLVGWTAGGRTDVDNLQLLCPFHNRLKHRWNLIVERGPDGTLTWRHPSGQAIRSRYQTTTDPPGHAAPGVVPPKPPDGPPDTDHGP